VPEIRIHREKNAGRPMHKDQSLWAGRRKEGDPSSRKKKKETRLYYRKLVPMERRFGRAVGDQPFKKKEARRGL